MTNTATAGQAATITFRQKDGVVLRDGEPVGRVEKGSRPTLVSALLGGDEETAWYGYDLAGNLVTSAHGTDTRKRAVREVGQAAEPMTVSDVHVNDRNLEPFTEVRLDWAGNTFFVSRYPDEQHWVVDALFVRGSSCPVFSNGAGTRCTAARVLQGEAHEAVENAVRLADVAP